MTKNIKLESMKMSF